MNGSRQTFRALNGLRFFAAFGVVLYHYSPTVQGFGALPIYLRRGIHAAPVALGFFYILSGFVLAHAYVCRAPETAPQRNAFWFARIARLYPVYLLAFILFLPIAYEKYLHHPLPGVAGPRTFVLGGILGMFAIQSWTSLSQAWNGPSWSLSVEAFFYFLFPFVLVPIYRAPWKKLLLILLPLWSAMIALAVAQNLKILPGGLWQTWLVYNPLFWSPLFFIGIATYKCAPFWSSISSAKASCVSAAALCLLIVSAGSLPESGADIFVNGGAAPLLALVVLAFSHPNSLSSRLAGKAVLYEAGAASYITYILQAPVWHMFRAFTDRLRHVSAGSPAAIWQFAAYLPLLLAISFLVQIWVERPVQKWLLDWRSARAEKNNKRALATEPIKV